MKKNNAFSLIELLIVIFILGILAATILPKLINYQNLASKNKQPQDKIILNKITKKVYKTNASQVPYSKTYPILWKGRECKTNYLPATNTEYANFESFYEESNTVNWLIAGGVGLLAGGVIIVTGGTASPIVATL